MNEPAKHESPRIELLIADDDADFRGTVRRRFRRRGWNIQEAQSGIEALELLNKRNFDVALLDMMMPGMSGVEVLDRIAADSRECRGDPIDRPGYGRLCRQGDEARRL